MKAFRDLKPAEIEAWAVEIERRFSETTERLHAADERLATLESQLAERSQAACVALEAEISALKRDREDLEHHAGDVVAGLQSLNQSLARQVAQFRTVAQLQHRLCDELLGACSNDEVRGLLKEREKALLEVEIAAAQARRANLE